MKVISLSLLFSLCLFWDLFVFIPVSYFLAYSLRACRSRYCIFQLFTWGRWRSANYWLILLHAGFPFFIFFHDSTCALFLFGFSPIHSLFFICLILTFLFFIYFALFLSDFYSTLCLFPTFTFFFPLHNLPSKGDPAFPLTLMFLTPFFEYRWLCYFLQFHT